MWDAAIALRERCERQAAHFDTRIRLRCRHTLPPIRLTWGTSPETTS